MSRTRRPLHPKDRLLYLRDWLERHADETEPPSAWPFMFRELLEIAATALDIDLTKPPYERPVSVGAVDPQDGDSNA